ncbi:MAG: hypothetical protein IJW10_01520 [Clostridia bacterium]|nr:hypothetical protein [Clostridia bacterium]
MKKFLIALLALAMLFCASCSAPDATTVASYTLPDGTAQEIEMKLASNTDIVQYLLYVPSTWVIKDQSASTVAYVSEENKTSVSVAQWNLTKEYTTIDAWWSLVKEDYVKTIPNFTLIEEGTPTTLGGAEAKNYIYTATFSGQVYKYNVVASIDQGSIHIITYTSTPELYDNTLAIYKEAILGSFRFS